LPALVKYQTVTPTGARGLEEIAQELGLKSKSELVAHIGRRMLLVSPSLSVKQNTEESEHSPESSD
jgi:RNA-binding protein YhbY